MDMTKPLPIHTLLLAIYPVLFLYSQNTAEFPATVIVIPILVIAAFALVCWLILSRLLGSRNKAAMVVSLLLLLAFSYGHAVAIVGNPHYYVFGIHIGHNKILMPIWALLFAAGLWAVAKTRRDLSGLTKVVNAAAALLVIVAAGQTVFMEITGRGRSADSLVYPTPPADLLCAPEEPPNIYYIVLDGYGRSDVLKEIYGHDNSEFLNYLRGKGFFVADRACANYPQTFLSFASALNLTYLDELAATVGTETRDHAPVRRLIADNALFRFLRPYGYTFAAFATGARVTQRRNIDLFMEPGPNLTEFQTALLDTTPLPAFIRGLRPYGIHRRRILYTLENLGETANLEPPLFVFAHVLAPHPPFVFDAQGRPVQPERRFTVDDGSHFMRLQEASRDEYIAGYRQQLIFINRKVRAAIDGLLAKSKTPPIIILQGDHGPGAYLDWEDPARTNMAERLGILSAYYLPGDGGGRFLWDDITPVNTFRIVLRRYFGAHCRTLKDESFYSTAGRPYHFINVTDRCKAPGQSKIEN